MHGGAILLVLAIVLVLNTPVFVLGFLATKSGLYLVPRLKRFFLVRWILPLVVTFVSFVVGIGLTLVHLDGPWPTAPFLSGWACLGVVCLLDAWLFVLWAYLKSRERNRRLESSAGN